MYYKLKSASHVSFTNQSHPFLQGASHLTQPHPHARKRKHGRSLTVMAWWYSNTIQLLTLRHPKYFNNLKRPRGWLPPPGLLPSRLNFWKYFSCFRGQTKTISLKIESIDWNSKAQKRQIKFYIYAFFKCRSHTMVFKRYLHANIC